jgi:hypothetical protein
MALVTITRDPGGRQALAVRFPFNKQFREFRRLFVAVCCCFSNFLPPRPVSSEIRWNIPVQ